jgi:DNA repair protein RadC
MKALAPHDRPREKLERLGSGALGDNELLAIVLGHGVPNAGALELANAVLTAVGGLHGLARTSPSELRRVPGIGAARAAQLLAAVDLGRRTLLRGRHERVQIVAAIDAARLLIPEFGAKPVEHFGVMLLDTKHRVLKITVVSVGTLDASIVHPREVFLPAILHSAASVVLVHNHPSGDPEPSEEDLSITRRLVEVGELVGIGVLDHVIVGSRGVMSFRSRQLL